MAHRRAALTRLELAVAVIIAAILAGLLVPAVQKLRAASDRTRCTNNLRALWSGVRSYHETRTHLPPGGNHSPPAESAGLSPGCRETEWSWAYHLLPHLGHGGIHRLTNNDELLASEVPQFYCSARRRTGARWNNRTMLDYAANAGTLENGTDGAIQRSTEKPFSFEAFTDGPGTTVLLAEKRLNVATFGESPGDRFGFATPGWTEAGEAHRFGILPPAADFDTPGDHSVLSEFGSSHRGVYLALFGDGAVRTIRYSVNPGVWRRACVRNDSENFNFNDLQ